MADGVSSNHQKFNLLNITNIGKPGSEGQMKVPVSNVGHNLLIEIFDLKTQTAEGGQSRLTMALKTLVEQSGVSIKLDGYSTEGDVLKAIGNHIENQQGASTGGKDAKKLSTEEKTLLQNLEIVMKAARKLNDDEKQPNITFDCFNEFNRETRYKYEGDKYQTERVSTKSTTAWSSYFKDALAFDSITFGDSRMNVANAMTSVGVTQGQTLGNQDHEDLLNHFSEKAQAKRGGNQKTVTVSEITDLKTGLAATLNATGEPTSRTSSKTPGAPLIPDDLHPVINTGVKSPEVHTPSVGSPLSQLIFEQKQEQLIDRGIHIAKDTSSGSDRYNVQINYPSQDEVGRSSSEEEADELSFGGSRAIQISVTEDEAKNFSDAIAGKTIKDGVIEVENAGKLNGLYRLDGHGRVIAKGSNADELNKNTSEIVGKGDVSQVFYAGSDAKCSAIHFKKPGEVAASFNRQTPLHIAVQRGFVKTVARLIDSQGVDALKTVDSDGKTPMHWAAENARPDVMNVILEKVKGVELKALLLQKDSIHDETPMHLAAQIASPDVMKAILEKADEKGIDIKDLLIVDKGTFLGTPMHLAAENASPDVMKVILEKVKDVELLKALLSQKNKKGETPMHLAAENASPDVMKVILEKVILEKVKDVELLEALRLQEDSSGVTPMILLLENASRREIKEMLDEATYEGFFEQVISKVNSFVQSEEQLKVDKELGNLEVKNQQIIQDFKNGDTPEMLADRIIARYDKATANFNIAVHTLVEKGVLSPVGRFGPVTQIIEQYKESVKGPNGRIKNRDFDSELTGKLSEMIVKTSLFSSKKRETQKTEIARKAMEAASNKAYLDIKEKNKSI